MKIQKVLQFRLRSEKKTDNSTVIVTGYGNNETDSQAYLEAGLRPDSVFIVNTRGERRLASVDLRLSI